MLFVHHGRGFRIDADRAFEILKWRSQATQVKLRTVATRLVKAVMREGLAPETVTVIDHLLLVDGPPDDDEDGDADDEA